MERDIVQLRSMNRRLGESLEWILGVLQNESEVSDQERLREQRHEALEALSYMKDVLVGKVTEMEESRLMHPKREDIVGQRPLTDPPPNHVLEPPSRQQLTSFRSLSPSRGSSFGSSTQESSRRHSARPNFPAPMGRLPVISRNTQRHLGEDSAGQKRPETGGDPLGVLQ